ncbi:MAG: proline dehydrogenase family protein [Gemmatimonadaceae bacterium]|nr:proline dehydrogenase family protein [Gemmatimonadaceae bacterium]
MSLARTALLRASRSQWLARQLTQRRFARQAVKKFMPGEELTDALGAADTLARSSIGTIITRLGESLTGERNTDEVRDHYIAALAAIAARGLPTVLSIKPTQLGLDTSVKECVRQVGAIAQAAAAHGTFIWIDMEDSSYVDRTLEVYEHIKSSHPGTGLALQAYLYRTPKDLERLLPLKPIIRLVKGAYAEPPQVAFPAKRDTDAAFVSLGETMLDASSRGEALPIFGTHDMNIVNRLVGRARSMQLTKDRFEVHMLYGIRSAEQRSLAASGVGVRCLISYGANWFPWYMRRLAERPANVWFVVKTALT